MAMKEGKATTTSGAAAGVGFENDARLSATTKRLIADLGRIPNARVEVIVVQKGKATTINMTDDADDVFTPSVAPDDDQKTTRRRTSKTPEAVPAGRARTVAAALRTLIKQGLNDDQIWPKIKSEFPNLSDNKKSYIAGQRKVLERKSMN